MKRFNTIDVQAGVRLAAIAMLVAAGGCGGSIPENERVAQQSCAAGEMQTCSTVAGQLVCGCTPGGRQTTNHRQEGDEYWGSSCTYQYSGPCLTALLKLRVEHCVVRQTSSGYSYHYCHTRVVDRRCCQERPMKMADKNAPPRDSQQQDPSLKWDFTSCSGSSECRSHRCLYCRRLGHSMCVPQDYPASSCWQ